MLPLTINNQEELEETVEQTEASSKTYKIDFETGEILPIFINDEEAVKQFAIKAIKTIRDKYLIYSSDYGCEIFYLIGETYSLEYLKIEVPRLIKEALMIDDRIVECTDFDVTKEGGSIYTSFTIVTNFETSLLVEVDI